MDVLVVEPLEDEVMRWLTERHAVACMPELARDPRTFRQVLHNVRAVVVPHGVTIDAQTLHHAPMLRAVGRVSAGAENIDAEVCARLGIEVVRSGSATGPAEAEFMMGALLSLLRRVPVRASDGAAVGRELGSATVGLVGMAPAARAMAQMLSGFGSLLVGYDPAMHASDSLWARWHVKPLGLRELLEQSDAVCVQLNYFSRYRGLLGDRFLPHCRPNQVIVSIAPSGVFDEAALAAVLASGRVAAAWLDSVEPGALDHGRPLADIATLQITPRIASTTRESRLRSAWDVAKRIDDVLSRGTARSGFRPSAPGVPTDLQAGPASP